MGLSSHLQGTFIRLFPRYRATRLLSDRYEVKKLFFARPGRLIYPSVRNGQEETLLKDGARKIRARCSANGRWKGLIDNLRHFQSFNVRHKPLISRRMDPHGSNMALFSTRGFHGSSELARLCAFVCVFIYKVCDVFLVYMRFRRQLRFLARRIDQILHVIFHCRYLMSERILTFNL